MLFCKIYAIMFGVTSHAVCVAKKYAEKMVRTCVLCLKNQSLKNLKNRAKVCAN